MKNSYSLLIFLFCFLLITQTSNAQGCPGCITALPSLPDDTIFMTDAPTGFLNIAYDQDISFRLPITTTPVAAVDSTTPPGFPISKFKISGLSNLPDGLSWELSKNEFDTDRETDGCVKICGIPKETGFFLVEVKLVATVFGLSNDAAFNFPITIYPEPDPNVPAELFGKTGCGEANVTIVNNIKSNGDPRFSYVWDFGNGQFSVEENPPVIHYSEPGTYFIFYFATIDTAGYYLSNVKVTATTCDDFSLPPIINGNPDLYAIITNAAGAEIFRTGIQENASMPASFNMNLPLGQGNYKVKIYDKDDGGLGGGDDFCGEIVFNRNTRGSFTQGNLTLEITTFHPLITVNMIDTVIVYEQPPSPVILPADIVVNCIDTLRLSADPDENITWFFEGNFFSDMPVIQPLEPGQYQAVYRDPVSGCESSSDPAEVPELVLPNTPFFINNNNLLSLTDTVNLPANFSIEWLYNDEIIPDENSFSLCATESGNFGVLLTDLATGCTATFDANIAWNPNFDCLATSVAEVGAFSQIGKIFPNPFSEKITVRQEQALSDKSEYRIFDLTGRLLFVAQAKGQQESLDLHFLQPGMYIFQLSNSAGIWTEKLMKH